MTNKKMTVFTMSMMTVAAVISLRGLPMMAMEGLSLIFYILFATVMFLVPASMVSAELGGAFGHTEGGVYDWVKAAFGSRWGFVAIWLQWIQNVIWYPTVLAFAAGSVAYLIGKPELANNGTYNGLMIIVVFWVATFVAFAGSNAVGAVTKYGVLLGTLIPGAFIIILGLIWWLSGNPVAFLETVNAKGIETHLHPHFFPHVTGLGSIAFLAGIILLFAGVEVQAVRANELNNPSRDFPKAIFISVIIIFILFLFGSLAVAAVIPANDTSLTAGLMEAFKSMLRHYRLDFLVPVMGGLTAFGAIGGVMSWISGPSKGLLSTAKEGELPPLLAKTNTRGVQVTLLIIQLIIVTILAALYFIMSNVNVAFFVLSAMTVTLYLVMYILMYAAAIHLRYTNPEMPRTYRVPGGLFGMWLTGLIGIVGVGFALIVGFFPPTNLPVGNPTLYVALVAGGLLLFISIPLIIHRFKKASWKK